MLSSHHAWAVARTAVAYVEMRLAIPQPGVFSDRLIADGALEPERLTQGYAAAMGSASSAPTMPPSSRPTANARITPTSDSLQLIAVAIFGPIK